MNEDNEQQQREEERTPQYVSLRDYLRVLRRERLLILIVMVSCGAAALAYSLSQPDRYDATASLAFRDPLADFGLIGLDTVPEESPQIRAAANAQLIARPEVTRLAALSLGADPGALIGMVSGQVSPQTNLVLVQASASSGERAAAIANSFAEAAKTVGTRDIQARLKQAERSVEREAERTIKDEKEGKGIALGLDTLKTRLDTIGVLRAIAEPVQVTQPATVPGEPTSPKPLRNTAVGLLVGLLIGTVLGFLRDALNRRFRTVQEVHREYGMPVLGRVAAGIMGAPGLNLDGGSSVSDHEFEAFRVLRTNLGYLAAGDRVRSLLVSSAMPEEGKTTVSMSLASAAALTGQRVLLVECDFRRPSFARRLGVEAGPGLADYLRGDASPAEIVRTQALRLVQSSNGAAPESTGKSDEDEIDATRPHLAYITSGSRPTDAIELLGSERFREFVESVSKAYDMVVIDGSPMLAVVDPLRIIPIVDALLLCVRVEQSTTDEAKAARSALSNLPSRPTGMVVTGLKRGGPDAYEYYYGY